MPSTLYDNGTNSPRDEQSMGRKVRDEQSGDESSGDEQSPNPMQSPRNNKIPHHIFMAPPLHDSHYNPRVVLAILTAT